MARRREVLRDTVAYGVGQAVRLGWYFGLYTAAARLAPPLGMPGEIAPGSLPDQRAILADVRRLFRQDLQNIRAGIYRLPDNLRRLRPITALARAGAILADLPAIHLRRRAGDHQDVTVPSPAYPRYFRQAFHFQTDGYLSERSAALYDAQVETLFLGAADAMRRQILPPLLSHLAGVSRPVVADLACGTGRFLDELRSNLPSATLIGVDLSLPYLRAVGGGAKSRVQAAGESLPFAEASLDAMSCIFLFHELPAQIRVRVVAEMARVLKPGGMLVFLDSLQYGDRPEYDGLLDRFPITFHEPYYLNYCRSDLGALFTSAGFSVAETGTAFMAKRLVLIREKAAA